MFNVHYVKARKSLILILVYGHFEKLSFKWMSPYGWKRGHTYQMARSLCQTHIKVSDGSHL